MNDTNKATHQIAGSTEPIAWRFARADGTSHLQKTPQEVGQTYTVPDYPPLGRPFIYVATWGFHATPFPIMAVGCSEYPFVERVRLGGEQREESGILVAEKRTSLWRADAALTLLTFAVDCAERAIAAQPGFTEKPGEAPRASQQWLADGAVADARAYLAGQADESTIRTFGNAHIRPDNPDAPFGERCALLSAYLALRACYLYHLGTSFSAIMDSGLARAADAVSTGRLRKRHLWKRERDWQNAALHARLKTLAPVGYSEPAYSWDWVHTLVNGDIDGDINSDTTENENLTQ